MSKRQIEKFISTFLYVLNKVDLKWREIMILKPENRGVKQCI